MSKVFNITGFADEIANDLSTQVESVLAMNIRHIEMRGVDGKNLIYHDDQKVRSIKAYLDDHGITLSALGSPLGKIGILDPFEQHYEEFKRAVEIAHMMDCKNIRMFSFYIPFGVDPVNYEAQVFDRIGSFADYAAKNDIVLLHENEKGIFGEKASECLQLMKHFYSAHFKAIFDFANFVQAGENTLHAYTLLKPYIAYIHVKDAMMKDGSVVPSGYGDGHVAEILKDLYSNGFDGFLSLEPHLFEFKGLESLENGSKKTVIDQGTGLSGYEAFSLAHRSLMDILSTIE